MTKIHMETEDVRETARRVDLTAGDLYFMPPKLRNAANSLTSSWQGGKAGQYAAELRRAAQILQRDVITLQRLSASLRQEVAEWENADDFGASTFQGIIIPIGFGTPASENNTNTEGFDWWGWQIDVVGGGAAVVAGAVGFGQTLSYVDYQSIGRSINKMVGNQKGGWVGKMDDLGHFIKKNPLLEQGTEAFGLGVGIWGDYSNGESLSKAVGSKAIEFAFTKGITYLIPGVGTAMLFYDGALLTGRLIAGAADLMGFDEQARLLENSIDSIDLSTYTEPIADAIYDYAENYVISGGD